MVFVVVPAALVGLLTALRYREGNLGVDFRYVFWPAGQAVLHGHSPYPPVSAHVLAERSSFVYPPIVAIVMAVPALLPVGVATLLMTGATVVALGATLWVLDVRDVRCYGTTLLSLPVLSCIQTASLSAFLCLGIALTWRYRARGRLIAVLLAAVIAAKLFLWPLWLWLAVARGVRCAALSALLTVALILTPWLLGFPGLHQYPHILSLLTDAEGAYAYTPRALAHTLGAGWRLSELVTVVSGVGVLLGGLLLVRRSGGELRLFGAAVLASLLLCPLVWGHYLVVLLPLIAITNRQFGVLWLAPSGLYLAGTNQWSTPTTFHIAASLVVMALMTVPALGIDGAVVTRPLRRALPT